MFVIQTMQYQRITPRNTPGSFAPTSPYVERNCIEKGMPYLEPAYPFATNSNAIKKELKINAMMTCNGDKPINKTLQPLYNSVYYARHPSTK